MRNSDDKYMTMILARKAQNLKQKKQKIKMWYNVLKIIQFTIGLILLTNYKTFVSVKLWIGFILVHVCILLQKLNFKWMHTHFITH